MISGGVRADYREARAPLVVPAGNAALRSQHAAWAADSPFREAAQILAGLRHAL
jgi:hypothetical protein